MIEKTTDPTPVSDDPVEQLLAKAEPRPTPPPEVVATAREAVFTEWKNAQRRRQQKWIGLAASVVAACVLWFSVNDQPITPIATEVAAIDKAVGGYHYRQEDGLLERRPEQTIVRAGDTVITEDDAALGLDWGDGGSLRLDSNTTVRFLQNNRIELLAGRIYFDSQFDTDEAVELTINTRYGDVQHVGTQFMTDLRDDDRLKVSVREGKVAINGIYHDAEAIIGEQVTLHGNSTPLTTNLATYGAEWQWVQLAAPVVDMDGRTFAQILEWVCSETGLKFHFASNAAKRLASRPVTGVDVEDPMALLRVSARAAELQFTTVDGVIVVSQRSP